MPKVHLHDQLRNCGATTVVRNQSSVTVGGKLWAVHGDPNSHGLGNLIASATDIWVEGILIIQHKPDNANANGLCPFIGAPHCNPMTAEGFEDVTVY